MDGNLQDSLLPTGTGSGDGITQTPPAGTSPPLLLDAGENNLASAGSSSPPPAVGLPGHGQVSPMSQESGTRVPSSGTSPPSFLSYAFGVRRRRRMQLPVSAPRRSCLDGFRTFIQECRQRDALLDSLGAEKVIGIFGFSLFGSVSLLPSTMDRVKDLGYRNVFMLIFGSIWVLASVGVLCGLNGKTDFEQAVCRHTGRLGVLGLAVLVVFHVGWTLPSDNVAGFYILLAAAFILHGLSWLMSWMVGENRIDGTTTPEAQQHQQ